MKAGQRLFSCDNVSNNTNCSINHLNDYEFLVNSINWSTCDSMSSALLRLACVSMMLPTINAARRVLHSAANQRIWWLSLCFIHEFGLRWSLIVVTFSVKLRDFLCHFSPIICLWLKIVAKSSGDVIKILNFNWFNDVNGQKVIVGWFIVDYFAEFGTAKLGLSYDRRFVFNAVLLLSVPRLGHPRCGVAPFMDIKGEHKIQFEFSSATSSRLGFWERVTRHPSATITK